MKKLSISILGSTGSVGKSIFRIIDRKKNTFKINFLFANKNFTSICKQITKYKPKYFIINNSKVFQKIKKKFKNTNTKILNKFEISNFKDKNDIVICALPGIAGLKPTIEIIKYSKKVLIANKESIICGWDLIKKKASKYKTKIIPIDSEHYSIMKLLEVNKLDEISKIYLTASGGPFLHLKKSKLKKIKPSDALKHPNWKMGKKITIDSATLMNKILELIEAKKLFDIPKEKIDIIIHPQSLVHAIVILNNGLVKFIYHETSMIIPIANAMFEKNFKIENILGKNFLSKKYIIKDLNFRKVNRSTFPIIDLKEKVNEYYSSPIIINAVNEVAVNKFLERKIPFLNIYSAIKAIMRDRNYKKYAIKKPKNLTEIYHIDYWARKTTIEKLNLK